MITIKFTKKNIGMALIALVLILLTGGGIFSSLVRPRLAEVSRLKIELKEIESNVREKNLEVKELAKGQPLFETSPFKDVPKISNMLNIENYLQELAHLKKEYKVTLAKSVYDEEKLFDSEEDINQGLYRSKITLDLQAATFNDLTKFINMIEGGDRLVTPIQTTYQYDEELDSEAKPYKSSLTYSVYYLKTNPKKESGLDI